MEYQVSKQVDFLTPITHIQGFGGKRGVALNQAGLFTVGDLLSHFPEYHLDFSIPLSVAEFQSDSNTPCSTVGSIATIAFPSNSHLFALTIQDSTGTTTLETKIHRHNLRDLKKGMVIKVHKGCNDHHDIHILKSESLAQLVHIPRYKVTEPMLEAGITQQFLVESLYKILHISGSFPERLPIQIENRYHFPSLQVALSEIHFPKNHEKYAHSHHRVTYERLYQTALSIRWNKKSYALPGLIQNGSLLQEQLRASNAINLTSSNETTLTQINEILNSPKRLHHLLQSELGSGKSSLAIMASLAAISSNNQVLWICRNEKAAKIQFQKISSKLSHLHITPSLLVDSISIQQKRQLIRSLKSGEINFIVLSQSQLTSSLGFNTLGLIIVDRPEHYSPHFRTELQRKGAAADLLFLRDHPITPIDRTIYCSDLELFEIEAPLLMSVPNMRTVPNSRKRELLGFLNNKIAQGESLLCIVPPKVTADESYSGSEELREISTKMKQFFGENIPITTFTTRNSSEEIDDDSVIPVSSGKQIFLCTEVQNLPEDMPQVSLAVIVHSQRFTASHIAAIRHDLLIQNESSWIFCLSEKNEQNHQDDSSALALFPQVYHDLETMLIPE